MWFIFLFLNIWLKLIFLSVGTKFSLNLPMVKCLNQERAAVFNFMRNFFFYKPMNFIHGTDPSIKWFVGGITFLFVLCLLRCQSVVFTQGHWHVGITSGTKPGLQTASLNWVGVTRNPYLRFLNLYYSRLTFKIILFTILSGFNDVNGCRGRTISSAL